MSNTTMFLNKLNIFNGPSNHDLKIKIKSYSLAVFSPILKFSDPFHPLKTFYSFEFLETEICFISSKSCLWYHGFDFYIILIKFSRKEKVILAKRWLNSIATGRPPSCRLWQKPCRSMRALQNLVSSRGGLWKMKSLIWHFNTGDNLAHLKEVPSVDYP